MFFEYNIFLLILSFIINFYPTNMTRIILSNLRRLNTESQITMIINGKGTQKILYDSIYNRYTPSKILINGNNANVNINVNNLNKNENEIIIKWNNNFKTCN